MALTIDDITAGVNAAGIDTREKLDAMLAKAHGVITAVDGASAALVAVGEEALTTAELEAVMLGGALSVRQSVALSQAANLRAAQTTANAATQTDVDARNARVADIEAKKRAIAAQA